MAGLALFASGNLLKFTASWRFSFSFPLAKSGFSYTNSAKGFQYVSDGTGFTTGKAYLSRKADPAAEHQPVPGKPGTE